MFLSQKVLIKQATDSILKKLSTFFNLDARDSTLKCDNI